MSTDELDAKKLRALAWKFDANTGRIGKALEALAPIHEVGMIPTRSGAAASEAVGRPPAGEREGPRHDPT